jgi:hypothetical protein
MSAAFEITWALSVRLIWSRIGEEKAIPVEGRSGIPELPCPDVVASHPDQAGSRKGGLTY